MLVHWAMLAYGRVVVIHCMTHQPVEADDRGLERAAHLQCPLLLHRKSKIFPCITALHYPVQNPFRLAAAMNR